MDKHLIEHSLFNSSALSSGSHDPALQPTPAVSVQWHDTARSIYCAHIKPMADDAGMTVEQLLAEGEMVGEDYQGNEIKMDEGQVLESIEAMGLWGFADSVTNTIHLWAAPATSPRLVAELVGHELGHLTGPQLADDLQEEMRADQFASVAAMTFDILSKRPSGQNQ